MRLRHRPWADEVLTNHPELFIDPLKLDDESFQKYINSQNVVLEIGMGKGDFLIDMAKKYPDYHFLGVEMQGMALAIAAKKILKDEIPNLKLLNINCAYLFDKLKDKSIKTIFLNFSDPWPKKRQHKRRLTYPTFLKNYCRILKDDGEVIFKSDNETLFKDSLDYFNSEESPFKIISYTFDYDGLDPYDAATEYEKKFRAQNIPIKRLIAKKR